MSEEKVGEVQEEDLHAAEKALEALEDGEFLKVGKIVQEIEEDIEAQGTEETLSNIMEGASVSIEQYNDAVAVLHTWEIDPQERDLSPDETVELAGRVQEIAASHAQVLSRGATIDRLQSILDALPKNLIGNFIRNRDVDIDRASALGWTVYEVSDRGERGMHSDGSSHVIVGDVILMVMDRDLYHVGQKVRQQRREARKRLTSVKDSFKSKVAGVGTGGHFEA